MMNTKIADECMALSLAGQITFPEAVGRMASAGVERYLVDLVGLQKLTYGADGGAHAMNFNFSEAPAVTSVFDGAAIKAAIADIQKQTIDYPTFLRRIMAAGCCHYEVYIHGKRAIYFGREGSQHIEHFPAAN